MAGVRWKTIAVEEGPMKTGSLVIPEIHNSMIFMANEECP